VSMANAAPSHRCARMTVASGDNNVSTESAASSHRCARTTAATLDSHVLPDSAAPRNRSAGTIVVRTDGIATTASASRTRTNRPPSLNPLGMRRGGIKWITIDSNVGHWRVSVGTNLIFLAIVDIVMSRSSC
jgi:hypothetical protein